MQTEDHPLTGLLYDLTTNLTEAMEACYQRAGLDYRPRFSPIVQSLHRNGPSSIRALSRDTRRSHSALSQTVAQMRKAGLIRQSAGDDRRERIIRLSPKAEAMLPRIERQWRATDAAAATIDAELGIDLRNILKDVLTALSKRSFADRIEAAEKDL